MSAVESGESHAIESWQQTLKDAIRDIAELTSFLELSDMDCAELRRAHRDFPLLVPRGFAAKMRKGDPRDPLLLQVLPQAAELVSPEGFGADPLDEHRLAENGLMRKYPGRALLISTGACPVHCRYCFRRSFPYSRQSAARDGWRRPVAALARAPGVRELILSGGDPLSLSNSRLERLLRRIDGIESIDTLRIHTRFPVVIPERVNSGLLELLERSRPKVVVVIHCNHANELGSDVESALVRLSKSVDWVLNQSVLLAGVNDMTDRLAALSRRLFECGVLPYYLHLLDRVEGTSHFDVAEERARTLIAELRSSLPGYLVPVLVREAPGELSKTPI
jgi:L-lysine 2,3-aminomutase